MNKERGLKKERREKRGKDEVFGKSDLRREWQNREKDSSRNQADAVRQAMLSRRLRLPYSVGLVAAGIFLAILPFAPKVALTKDLIFTALLPPLLFEAAFFIHWDQLRRDFSV